MALLADTPNERVDQMLMVTERLTALIGEETRRIGARLPPLDGADADERNRLANAYRLELARIGQDRSLIDAAAPAALARLRQRTETLQRALSDHAAALGAVKLLAEGLVQAMAEEVARQRLSASGYGAQGALAQPSGLVPTILDRSA